MTPTPPPWRVEYGPERTGRQIAEIVEGRPGLAEPRIVHDGPEEGDAKADADLMAAAPEMAEALGEVERIAADRNSFVLLGPAAFQRAAHIAQQALAKAEGRQ